MESVIRKRSPRLEYARCIDKGIEQTNEADLSEILLYHCKKGRSAHYMTTWLPSSRYSGSQISYPGIPCIQ